MCVITRASNPTPVPIRLSLWPLVHAVRSRVTLDVRCASACVTVRPSPYSRAMTFVVPPGSTASGVALPTSAAAASPTVPSPPQTTTTSGPSER